MSCEYAGALHRADLDAEGPVAVWACHACPGGVLVLDPHHHEQAAHPQPATVAAAPRIPAPRGPGARRSAPDTVLDSRRSI